MNVKAFRHRPALLKKDGMIYAVGGSHWEPLRGMSHQELLAEYDALQEALRYQDFKILSTDGVTQYKVERKHTAWSCECLGFLYRRRCRHIAKAKEQHEREE